MYMIVDEHVPDSSVIQNYNINNILCNYILDEIEYILFKESKVEQKDGYKQGRKNPENISRFLSIKKSQA